MAADELRACAACHAANVADAEWCGQCGTVFAGAGTAADRRLDADDDVSAPQPEPGAIATPGFRTVDGALEWVCAACGGWTTIDSMSCAVCQAPFDQRDEATAPVRDWRRARLVSVVAPGVGHIIVGRAPSGIARVVLFWLWALGAVLLGADAARGAVLPAAVLVAGAVTVHVLTLGDLGRARKGLPERLAGRFLLWLVVGVTGAVLVAGTLPVVTSGLR